MIDEKLQAIISGIKNLLDKAEMIKQLEKVDYRIIQLSDEVINKIYEIADLIEKIENIINE